MKQLVILSGKGGTGKTTLASSIIKLSNTKSFCDCDVDAPNLHLLDWENLKKTSDEAFYGSKKAYIDSELCIKCGKCKDNCRFNAIDENISLDMFYCEGCGVCSYVCPTDAITLKDNQAGFIELFNDLDYNFTRAELEIGNGNSGLLVKSVKDKLLNHSKEENLLVIDGSPGIGCPVIASISGVDYVLIVAEPTLSGISDFNRILKTSRKFDTKICLCINKYDINKKLSEEIIHICNQEKVKYLGSIPFDRSMMNSINKGLGVIDSNTDGEKAIREIYYELMNWLQIK